MIHNQLKHWKHTPSSEESTGAMANGHSWKKCRFNSETAEKGFELDFVTF